MTLLLGIDLGTSYFKVGLFDPTGALKGFGRVAVTTDTPEPQRSELSVDRFWGLLRRGLAEAQHQAGAGAADIAGISYSSQANTFVLLDEREEPLTPLVLWTDLRADPLDSELERFAQTTDFSQHTGLSGITSRSAVAKLRWFQKHRPAIWQRSRRIMTISDYFLHALTGERVGDAGTAALLGLQDLTEQKWWPGSLHAFGVDRGMLSTALRPGNVAGKTRAKAAEFLGLPSGIEVAAGSLDHHVAALGAGIGVAADVSISTGTVLAALALTDRVHPQPRCFHGPHFTDSQFYRLAFEPMGAGQLEEYQQSYAPAYTIDQLIAAAQDVPPGRRPDHRAQRDGGLQDHALEVRCLLEKIALSHDALVKKAVGEGSVRAVVATGGGARSDVWLQIKADILGLPVLSPAFPESACLGAAMLAGTAAGFFRTSTEAAQAMRQPMREYLPDPANTAVYRNLSAELS